MTARSLNLATILLAAGWMSSLVDGAEFHSGDTLIDKHERAILGVSTNGTVVTGSAFFANQSDELNTGDVAYRWTPSDGFRLVEGLPAETVVGNLSPLNTPLWNHNSTGRAISADGNTIVGTSSVAFDLQQGTYWAFQAFRWTEQSGTVPLGVLPGYQYSQATDVSHDGNVIVGFSEQVEGVGNGNNAPQGLTSLALTPFRWSEAAGMQPLELPSGFTIGRATNVSSDGQVVAGVLRRDHTAESYAFRWTAEAGIQRLSERYPGVTWDTSADGSVVVGQVWEAENATFTHAFRWTVQNGTELLNESTAISSTANTVSADGLFVLGSYLPEANFRAGFWDNRGRLRDLQDVLANEYGLSESLAGWQLYSVRGISEDGTVIHGVGETPDGLIDDWIAVLDIPLTTGSLAGNFNHDEVIDSADLDLLGEAIRSKSTSVIFDLDRSGGVDKADLDILVHDILGTYYGDANLDHEFNTLDVVEVFQAGKYEDSEPRNADWAAGDWDQDGDFTTSDLVLAFQDGGYEQGPRSAHHALMVPEPYGLTLVSLGAPFLLRPWRVRLV